MKWKWKWKWSALTAVVELSIDHIILLIASTDAGAHAEPVQKCTMCGLATNPTPISILPLDHSVFPVPIF